MSAEDFLKRWSRRKRAAATEPAAETAPPVEAAIESGTVPPLPPIDSIEAGSDISAFLAPGVPSAVSQAALRRAWSADPAIRDFIGLSENAWDFTAVDGVPGFGAIDPDSVERLLGRVIGTPEASGPEVAEAAPATEPAPANPNNNVALGLAQAAVPQAPESSALPDALNSVNAAVRDKTEMAETAPATPRRRHGGALPD